MSGPSLATAGAWHGGKVRAGVHCVLADNPGPMTLDGTNTWVISGPDRSAAVIIDPGPDSLTHYAAIDEVLATQSLTVTEIVLTHRHSDHSEAAAPLSERLGGIPIRAVDATLRSPSGTASQLCDGDVIDLGDAELRVLASPGHTDDCVSFGYDAGDGPVGLLTGDTILGRGTTVIVHPDGELGPYLDTLQKLRDYCRRAEDTYGRPVELWPGHGPTLPNVEAVCTMYLAHRRERLDQVLHAIRDGARYTEDVVDMVYSDVSDDVRFAAELSVQAQLDYLATAGEIKPIVRRPEPAAADD